MRAGMRACERAIGCECVLQHLDTFLHQRCVALDDGLSIHLCAARCDAARHGSALRGAVRTASAMRLRSLAFFDMIALAHT